MERRGLLILFCLIAILAILLLASSLHDVQFQPGRVLSRVTPSTSPISMPEPDTLPNTPLWKLLLFWAAFVINLIIFFYLLPPEVRKKILRQAVSFAIGALVLLIALRYRVIELPSLFTTPPTQGEAITAGPTADQPVPIFQPPQMTPWMNYLISFFVLQVFLLIIWLAYRWWRRRQGKGLSSLQAIAGIAQASLDDLAAGQDWSDVIVRSYVRMGDVVGARRGLHRQAAMTPREFAARLERAGLPTEAVHGLTSLFESVRYGHQQSSQADIHKAMDCLSSILSACGEPQ